MTTLTTAQTSALALLVNNSQGRVTAWANTAKLGTMRALERRGLCTIEFGAAGDNPWSARITDAGRTAAIAAEVNRLAQQGKVDDAALLMERHNITDADCNALI
jgi:hypothetical protein